MNLTATRRRSANPDPRPAADPELAARLPVGYRDPDSRNRIPDDLWEAFAAIPADVEQKLRRQLYGVDELFSGSITLHPSTDNRDLETALVWKKNNWARQQLAREQRDAETAAHAAAFYTCRGCGEVVAPNGVDRFRHTQRRPLVDGTSIVACDQCATVAEQLVAERLAAVKIDGKTRRDRVAAILDRPTP
jgi:hypothetical protein